jgi:transposase
MGKIKYDQSFKKTIIELLDSGKSVKELTKEYGVSQASIHRWNIELKTPLEVEEETARIKALEKELKNVKLERDILKKAVSIFSKSDK